MFRLMTLLGVLASATAFAPSIQHATTGSSALRMGKIVVELDKVTGLQDEDTLGTSDPYVKFELEQDNWVFDKDYGDRKSTRKGGETSPVYGETFEWDEIDSLENMVLRCKVMDDDPLFDDKIGSCAFELEGMDLTGDPQEFVKVVDDNWFSQDAKIFLKIAYQP